MAIVKLAAPIAGIRGQVGGIIYSANKSGPYVKQWAKPANPNSEEQSIERSYMAQIPQLWRDLTAGQRGGWAIFAALPAQQLVNSLGETYYATGYNWFTKCTIRLFRVGRTPLAPAPTIARPSAPTISDFRVAVDGTESNVATGGTASADSENMANVAANGFDGVLTNFWQSLPGLFPHWLEYQLAAPLIIREYALWTAVPTFGSVALDWTFEGYNGATWDVLDTVSLGVDPIAGWATFHFTNETAYTRYRIQITNTRVNPPDNGLLWEMEYFQGILNHSRIIYPSAEFSSGSYDLILHVAMSISEVRTVQYPGYYEVLATQTPGDSFTDFQTELVRPFGTILEGRQWYARLYRQTSEGIRSAASTALTTTIGA